MERSVAAAIVVACIAFAVPSAADPFYDKIYAEFPKDVYIVGIGEVQKSGNALKDRRVSEILARAEIAKQIKVRVKEETTDIMCERGKSRLFKDKDDCRNEIVSVIETSVDEFLEGSRIVKHDEKDGTHLAVAVIEKRAAASDLDRKAKEAAESAQGEIRRAKDGDRGAAKKAQDQYLKALTYSREKEAIEGVRGRAGESFEDLEKELLSLQERQR